MASQSKAIAFAAALLLLAYSGGCGGPSLAKMQRYDPATAAAKAIELYDRNADAKLSTEELQAAPALAEGRARIDKNKDGMLTREEIELRLIAIRSQSDLVPVELRVSAQRRPLAGAHVTFTPESFMGEGLQSYTGTTSEGGNCMLPGEEVKLPGMLSGLYNVNIVHQEQNIDTVRGCEVSDDIGNRLEIAL